MPDPLIQEAFALALFVVFHFGPTRARVRRRIVAVIGETAYRALFALAAAASLGGALIAWREAATVVLWTAPPGWHHAAMTLNLFAFVMAAGGLARRDPEPCGALVATRWSPSWGVGLWAATHVVSSGHLASVMLFATLAVVAVAGAAHRDRRERRERGVARDAHADGAAHIPFAAIPTGRARIRLGDIGWRRVAIGLAAYGTALALHGELTGRPLIGL